MYSFQPSNSQKSYNVDRDHAERRILSVDFGIK